MVEHILLYLTLYIIYKIKVMFLQNWYPRETNVMFYICPEMYPFLHSGITILTGSSKYKYEVYENTNKSLLHPTLL